MSPSIGSTLPHARYHVKKKGGLRGDVRGRRTYMEPSDSNPNIPPVAKVPVRASPSHPGWPACRKRMTLSRGIDLLTRA